jgi:hypothetical protein
LRFGFARRRPAARERAALLYPDRAADFWVRRTHIAPSPQVRAFESVRQASADCAGDSHCLRVRSGLRRPAARGARRRSFSFPTLAIS